MTRLSHPPGPPSAARRRLRRHRLAVVAVLACGGPLSAGGCASARRTVARPVVGVMRAVPGVRRFVPPPAAPARVLHAPAPAPTPPPTPAPPPPEPRASEPTLSPPPPRSYRRVPVDRFAEPVPPAPAPAPRPLPGGGQRPTLIAPPGIESSPSERRPAPSTPPAEGDAAPPAPAPGGEPEAYYPVGRGPVASLWNRLSTFGFKSNQEPAPPTAAATQLVSHEGVVSHEGDRPVKRSAGRRSAPLIRLGLPSFGSTAGAVTAGAATHAE